MPAYVDLHCHWVADIDDGAPEISEGIGLLRGLAELGFATVLATPHMRAGLFDNSRADLERAYARMQPAIGARTDLPEVGLSCEHHLDDTVFARLLADQGLPYPGGHGVLIELPTDRFPLRLRDRLFELRCKRLRPVLAHPERYRPVWKDIDVLDPLVDGGAVLLLDVGALVGHNGRSVRRTAEELLEAGYYYAACSDAHRVADLDEVGRGIDRLTELAGKDETAFMLEQGPRSILDGTVED